jgi:hypothetical protein
MYSICVYIIIYIIIYIYIIYTYIYIVLYIIYTYIYILYYIYNYIYIIFMYTQAEDIALAFLAVLLCWAHTTSSQSQWSQWSAPGDMWFDVLGSAREHWQPICRLLLAYRLIKWAVGCPGIHGVGTSWKSWNFSPCRLLPSGNFTSL